MDQHPTGRRATRRAVLRGALAIAGGGLAAALGTARAQIQKISQEKAQYQTFPNNDQMCGNCRNFEPPHACRVVEGHIVPNGWSMRWGPRAD